MTVDLNADVGEGYDDAPMFGIVTSVNIACGAHAGDDDTMSAAILAAKQNEIAIGAHPGYDDRENFGRIELRLSLTEIKMQLLEQVEALARVADRHRATIRHVKPHGALYTQAAADPLLAMTLAEALSESHPELRLVGFAGSALPAAGRELGLQVSEEGFADRRYRSDGTLASRTHPSALISDPEEAARQAVALARGEPIATSDGGKICVKADTICCHADTPGAPDIARAVHSALLDAGIGVASA